MIPPLSIIILAMVLTGIMLRESIPLTVPIWGWMLLGSIGTLLAQQISWHHALHAINWEIIGYLWGVFVIAEALEQSGLLEHITDRLFTHCTTGTQALYIVVFALGLSSALLMNDTTAIIGAPIILQLGRKHPALITPLLLALAYSITLGSVFSPVGNPQNLLIALHSKMSTPFTSFFKTLIIPTLLNLLITALILTYTYRDTLSLKINTITPLRIHHKRNAYASLLALIVFALLMTFNIIIETIYMKSTLDFDIIAIISTLPIFIASPQRHTILKKIDWGTLVFFISLFIIIQSVWDSGFIQTWLDPTHHNLSNIPTILSLSALISQMISNVPFVALYLPLLHQANAANEAYLALAAGSTVAGNLFVFGAASNIIIVQNVEKRGKSAFSFWQFTGLGTLITVINLGVYAVFLML